MDGNNEKNGTLLALKEMNEQTMTVEYQSGISEELLCVTSSFPVP